MHRVVSVVMLAAGIVLNGHVVEAEQEGDLEGVKAANQAFYDAASARDLAQMAAVWAREPYVRAIHPTSERVDAGWEQVRGGFQSVFERYREISVAMPEPHVRVGDEVAWVTGEEWFKARGSSGEDVSATLLGTNVFERSGDRWLMVHHHVSVARSPQE